MRGAVGSRLGRMLELTRELRLAGIDAAEVDALERAVREVAATTDARLPGPAPGAVQAALASLLVSAMELSPRRLRGYGELADEDASYLERESGRLEKLVDELVRAVDGRDR
jgi:hypothetical protein